MQMAASPRRGMRPSFFSTLFIIYQKTGVVKRTLLTVHAHQKFIVVFGLLQAVFHKIHGFYRVHVGQVFTQNPHTIQSLLVLQQVVTARAGSNDVDSGEDALVGQVAIPYCLYL